MLPSIKYEATTRLAAKKIDRIQTGRLESEPLHTAAEQGQCRELLALLGPAEVDLRDGRQNTPLHLAADEGHLDCVATLIDAKADITAKRVDTATPLHLAASNGHSEVLAMLISEAVAQKQRCADRNGAICQEQERLLDGRKKIGDKIKIELCEQRLKEMTCIAAAELAECADFNCETTRGCTALHRAAKEGYVDCIKMIDQAYREDAAKVFATFDKDNSGTIDQEELNAINSGCGLGLDEAAMLDLLGESGELNFREEFDDRGLPVAGKSFLKYWVALKTSHADMYKSTALHEAAAAGNIECCIHLLKMYADPNLLNQRGQTPRDVALARNHTRLAALFEEATNPESEQLVLAGSTEWHKLWYQLEMNRQLKRAASAGDMAVMVPILTKGLDPAQFDKCQNAIAPLQQAVDDANLQFRRDNDRGPLHDAECALLMAGDTLEKYSEQSRDQSAEAMEWIDELDRHRNTLLAAAMAGRTEAVELLIAHKAQVDVRDKTGRSPLLLAAMNGHWACLTPLIASGELLQGKDLFGWTPLHLSAKQGHAKCVAVLIEAKADLGAFDGYGCSPIVWSMKAGHQDCLTLLQEAGAEELAMTKGSSSKIFSEKAKAFSKTKVHDEGNSSYSDAASDTFNNMAFSKPPETFIDMGLRLLMRERGGVEDIGGVDK